MNTKLKLFYVDSNYLEYLREIEPHVWTNQKGKRPHIGVLLHIEEVLYIAPLTSDKNDKYKNIDHEFVTRLFEKKTASFIGALVQII